jgi:hypothetical protein
VGFKGNLTSFRNFETTLFDLIFSSSSIHTYYGLRNLLKSRSLNKATKCKIYKTLVRPVVLYGSESWILTKADEEKLRIFLRRRLRRFYCRIRENGVWRTKYNDELYSLHYDLGIVRAIKVARMR